MRRLEIYINGSLLDIDEQTIFSLNLKANDVTNLSARFINYTSLISVPITDHNITVFGYSNLINSSSPIPYNTQMAKVILSGVTAINNGLSILEEAGTRFKIRILDSSVGFFDAINGRYLRDLDLDSHDALVDLDATCDTTSGVVSPLINYGNTIDSTGSFNIHASSYLPSFYLHTIVDRIFADNGYGKAGSLFSDTRYLKMIIPFSKDKYEYSDEFADYYTSKAQRVTPSAAHLVIAGLNIGNQITTDTITQNESGVYSNASGYIAATTSPVETSVFDATVNVTINVTVTGGSAHIRLWRVGAVSATDLGIEALTGTATYVASVPLTVIEARQYVLISEISSGTPTITVNSLSFDFVVLKTPKDWKFAAELLPEIEQSVIIKELAIQFGLVFTEDNGVVNCNKLEDIIADRSGADVWTEKRVRTKDDIDFSPASFAKNNYFRYNNQDDLTPDIYQGNLTIQSENATEQKTVYTSPFNASETQQTVLTTNVLTGVAYVPIYETSTDRATFDNTPGLRIALVRDSVTNEVCIFDSGQTDFKVAYFHDPAYALSLRPQYYIDVNYSLLSAALQEAKMVNRYYNLTDADISNFDFTKIVFDDGVYFLKQNVPSYVSGVSSKVLFLKL